MAPPSRLASAISSVPMPGRYRCGIGEIEMSPYGEAASLDVSAGLKGESRDIYFRVEATLICISIGRDARAGF
jgi:hypothetical protein